MSTQAWRDQAACKGKDPDAALFFDPPGEKYGPGARQRREARAKAVCAACPVRAECLDYAIERPERYGIYGGMSEEERAAEKRRRLRRAATAARREQVAS